MKSLEVVRDLMDTDDDDNNYVSLAHQISVKSGFLSMVWIE